ncbi:RNA polymerase sigma factor [Sphingobacterium suaedae]|uniref:RNA polymerase sigma factor n=1 Tax=Sphingobacterium suaedae TaxID=1686402 RepID=A0ABW5KLA7_9SPHI
MDFEQLYSAYSPRIFRVCLGYFNDAEKAKDVMQDTFVTVFENLGRMKHQENISGWIYRIASNKCLRQLAHERKNDLANNYHVLNAAATESSLVEDDFVKLHRCIASLPPLDRLIIGFFLEDVKQEKIADIVGLSHTNVRVRIHRIKDVLAKKMKNDESQF